jgi:hypothetical protein
MKDNKTSVEETEQVLEETSIVENKDTEISESLTEEPNLTDSVMEKIYKFIKNKQNEDFNEKETKSESTEEAIKNNDQEESKSEEISDGSEVRRLQKVSEDSEPPEELKTPQVVGDFDGDLNEIFTDEKKIKDKKLENHTSIEDALKLTDVEVDWYLLDLALQTEIGDEKLSSEDRKSLPDSSFCGPGRSFPVSDCAYVAAARRLIEKAKLSKSQKDNLTSSVDERAKGMSCNPSESIEDKIEKLTAFFEVQLNELKQKFAKITNDTNDKEEEVMSSNSLEIVENPSEGSSDESSPTGKQKVNKLGSYEQKFIDNYRKILNEDGEMAAENFFIQKARYLPKGFHPRNYLN